MNRMNAYQQVAVGLGPSDFFGDLGKVVPLLLGVDLGGAALEDAVAGLGHVLRGIAVMADRAGVSLKEVMEMDLEEMKIKERIYESQGQGKEAGSEGGAAV